MILSNNEAIDVDKGLPFTGVDCTRTDFESSTADGSIYQEIYMHYDFIQNHLKPPGEDTSTFIPKEQFRGHEHLKCQSAESDPELYSKVSSPNTSEVFYSTRIFKTEGSERDNQRAKGREVAYCTRIFKMDGLENDDKRPEGLEVSLMPKWPRSAPELPI